MPAAGRSEENSHVNGPAWTTLAMMPISCRHKQTISRLQDFIEDGRVLRRRLFRHTPHRIGNWRAENLPALGSFYLKNDEVLRIVVYPEGSVRAGRYDHAGIGGLA